MSSTWKNNIEITIFGESHGKAIGIVLGNLPSGIKIDLEEVAKEMKRRAPGQDKMSTARKEADKVEIMSGLQDDVTTGAPLCGIIYNSDQHSKDYGKLKDLMRPGHADYPGNIRYNGFNDYLNIYADNIILSLIKKNMKSLLILLMLHEWIKTQ